MKIHFKNREVKSINLYILNQLIEHIEKGKRGIVIIEGEIINIAEIAFTT